MFKLMFQVTKILSITLKNKFSNYQKLKNIRTTKYLYPRFICNKKKNLKKNNPRLLINTLKIFK